MAHSVYTLCPNKSDPLADFLMTCNRVYRIEHNFMYTYPLPICVTKNNAKFLEHRSVTEKSYRKQDHNVKI